MQRHDRSSALALAVVACVGVVLAAGEAPVDAPSLKELAPKGVLIGAALNQAQSDGKDPVAREIVTRHFNTITPENLLKWEVVHPEPDRYVFDAADRFVALGEQRDMFLVGHVLLWHQQTPGWVFKRADGTPPSRDELLERLRSHIGTVVGRYKGRIHGWDVVNEALDEDGRLRKTPWLEIIGEDYIAKAFEFAHAADPQAQLYYNDYNLPKAEKRAGALRIVRDLRARGLRIDGIGEQGHWLMDWPPLGDVDAMLTELGASGVKTHITELDIDVLPRDPGMYGANLDARTKYKAETNLYPDALPPAKQQELAERYAGIFRLFMKHRDSVARVTFWGITDRNSWLNGFPIPGRVNHPLLWDRNAQPKPAFDAVVKVLQDSGKGER